MKFAEPERCDICGHLESRDLQWSLVHWKDAPTGMAYEHVPACRDRIACRGRVEQAGERWPLVSTKRSAA